MDNNIKGIILAAGYGTRFLPITKTIPKEMLPIVNIPSIHFIIEEFIEAGIKDIIVVSHRNKKSLEDYFDKIPELEHFFVLSEKKDLLHKIKPYDLNVAFIRQKEMTGPGDALLLAEPFIGNCPFVVAFPDDIVMSPVGLTQQLCNVYEKYNKSVISIMKINEDVSRYGVVAPGEKIEEQLFKINDMVEKPKKGSEPSNSVSIGRYLFKPEMLNILSDLKKKHEKGEFYLTGGIQKLAEMDKMLGCYFKGKRLDIGEPKGYILAFLEYLKTQEEYDKILKDFIAK